MPSDFINRKLAQTIFHAFDFAKFIGKPLNVYTVINFRETDPEMVGKVMGEVREKCRRWLKRRYEQNDISDSKPLYVFTFENPRDSGAHVNWVTHIPAAFQAEFCKKVRGWVEKAQQAPTGHYDVKVKKVNPYTDKSLAKYILKGTDPLFILYFHLEDYADEPQGPIHGRRAGACIGLNKAARDAAGFIPKKHREKWKLRAWAREILPASNEFPIWEASSVLRTEVHHST